MRVKENNKLIAEFMGLTQGKPNETCWKHDWFDEAGAVTGRIETHLLFHSDWNWLMSVVEKIENLQYKNNNDVFKVVIDYGMCTIYNMISDLEVIVNVSKSTKIEAVYNACVEFIKWFML
jgi:hypothetical protein